MKDFRDLQVWQNAHQLVLGVYSASQTFPREELYGLTSQVRRAAVSVPCNLAEGCGRNSDGELARFAEIAMESASETEYLLLLANDLKILDSSIYRDLDTRTVEVKRMLASLIRKVKAER
jgi:four helix bundle protein